MRWPWQHEEAEEQPPDERLAYEECESLHSLMVAASVAEEMGETELRQQLLTEARLILRKGFPQPCIASVHSLKRLPADSSPSSERK